MLGVRRGRVGNGGDAGNKGCLLARCGGHSRRHGGGFARAGVDDQVNIPLPVAKLHVLKAVVLVGQRQHGFREKADGRGSGLAGQRRGRGMQRELAGACAHQVAAQADVVAQVEQFVEREEVFAHIVFAHIHLHALPALLQLRKTGFTLNADCHDAPGDGGFDPFGGEFFGGKRVAQRAKLRHRVGEREAVGVGAFRGRKPPALTDLRDLRELVAAKLILIFFKLRFVLRQEVGARFAGFVALKYSGRIDGSVLKQPASPRTW